MPSPSSPTTEPNDRAAGRSGASPTGSPGGSSLVADAGPAFDPEAAAKAPAPAPPADVAGEGWDEDVLRGVLGAKGLVLHGLLAVEAESTEWIYTAADLDAIAPPLTRILNRYDATRAAAAAGDELAVAIGFGGYAIRSYGERRAAIAQLRADAGAGPAVTWVGSEPPDVADAAGDDDAGAGVVPPLAGRTR